MSFRYIVAPPHFKPYLLNLLVSDHDLVSQLIRLANIGFGHTITND
jgi:hypothetical protein